MEQNRHLIHPLSSSLYNYRTESSRHHFRLKNQCSW